MAETEVDRKFAARKLRWGIYFVTLSALFLFAASRIHSPDAWFATAVISFALLLFIVIWFDDFFRDIYRCPNCRVVLHRPKMIAKQFRDGDPVTFLCERCDVNWDTGDVYSTD